MPKGEMIKKAFSEVYNKKPKTVPANKKGPALRKQLVAIALSKAKRDGLSAPRE